MDITKEDVLKVVSELKNELTDVEVNELLKRYNEIGECFLDPWYIIIEDLMYNLIDERNEIHSK